MARRTLEGMDISEFFLTFGAVIAMVLVGLLATVPTALELTDGTAAG